MAARRRIGRFVRNVGLMLCAAMMIGVGVLWPWSYRDTNYLIFAHWYVGDTSAVGRFLHFDTYEGGVAISVRVQRHTHPVEAGRAYQKNSDGAWQSRAGGRGSPVSSGGYVHTGRWYTRLGFDAEHEVSDRSPDDRSNETLTVAEWQLCVPFWALLALFASPWAIQLISMTRQRRRQRRIDARVCLRCGYDLRASPGRCPECGTVTPVTNASPLVPSPSAPG
jgi:hypothetical protein